MYVNCKEMISYSNEDYSKRIELLGCKFQINGRAVEGMIVFPKVRQTDIDTFEYIHFSEGDSFKIYIPEE